MVEKQQVKIRIGVEFAPAIAALGQNRAALLEAGIASGVELGGCGEQILDQTVDMGGVVADQLATSEAGPLLVGQPLAQLADILLADFF